MLKKHPKAAKRILSVIMALLFIIPAGIIASAVQDWVSWNGKGLIDSPYLLQSPEDFTLLSENVNSGINYKNTYFKLRYPIDLSLLSKTWQPIGTEETPFSGIFDGDNKEIDNLNRPLFGYLGLPEGETVEENATPTIRNIRISVNNQYIYSRFQSYGYTFSPVVLINKGTVQGCSNYAKVNLTGFSFKSMSHGGIVGENYALVEDCVNYGTVGDETESLSGYFGGIVAKNYGTVSNCVNEGTVAVCISNNTVENNTAYAGGIVGTSFEGKIENCINNGKVFASYIKFTWNQGLGGICGEDILGQIVNCTNNATLSGTVGGIICCIGGSKISNCFNFGGLSGKAGGIVYNSAGKNGVASKIENCANFAALQGESVTGITGGASYVANCFNSGDLFATSAKGIGGTNIENCYNSGNFKASQAAGLISYGSVKDSYNSGTMVFGYVNIKDECLPIIQEGTVTNGYYDGIKNGMFSVENGGTSLTFSEMTDDKVLEAEGKMDALSSGFWTKRENDSEYYYYPELKFFANHVDDVVRQKSLESVKTSSAEIVKITPSIDLQAKQNLELKDKYRLDISAVVQGNGEVMPTGMITFKYHYSIYDIVFGESALLSDGAAEYTVGEVYKEPSHANKLPPGEYSVSAYYGGDENYNPTHTTITYKVEKYSVDVVAPVVDSYYYNPSRTLSDIPLPWQWTWDNPDIVPEEGENYYSATYSLIKLDRDWEEIYNTVTVQIPLTILPPPPPPLSLDKNTLQMKYGQKTKLNATLSGIWVDLMTVEWTSSNPEVATVDSEGNVTAVGPGTAVITASAFYEMFTDSCEVTVTMEWWQWIIRIILNWFGR